MSPLGRMIRRSLILKDTLRSALGSAHKALGTNPSSDLLKDSAGDKSASDQRRVSL